MKSKIDLVARLLLGLIFTVFGLNKFLHFLPMPAMTGQPGDFFGALGTAGYFFPFMAIFETVSGILLLINKYVGLALVVLAPITLNILMFHAVLAHDGLPLAIIVVVLNAYLGFFVNKSKFEGILSAN